MKYDWEDQITPEIMSEIQAVLDGHGDLEIVGVCVGNPETGEGALVSVNSPDGSFYDADIATDILGDADARYKESLDAMRATSDAIRRGRLQ